MTTLKFQVGDVVTVKSPGFSRHQERGIVNRIIQQQHDYVRWQLYEILFVDGYTYELWGSEIHKLDR